MSKKIQSADALLGEIAQLRAALDVALEENAQRVEVEKRLREATQSTRWECESCGAQFYKIGPAVLYDGVHRCSKCVEVEVLAARCSALSASLAAARAVVEAVRSRDVRAIEDMLIAYDAVAQEVREG